MFGLKKWMDNIVRTKKSKSKKHSETRNGIMVGSPTLIRRIEISPLQTTAVVGRAGWKTPDSPGKTDGGGGGGVGVRIESIGDDRFRYNYQQHHHHHSHHTEVKKVIIESRPQSKRTSTTVLEERKHYSHSSGTSEFGSVMNYISSPESAYYTGYSTHSDDCLSPATAAGVNASNRPKSPIPPPPVAATHQKHPVIHECYGNSTNSNNKNINSIPRNNGPFASPSFSTELIVPQINCPSSPAYIDFNISPAPSPRQRPRIRTNPWYKTQQNSNLVPNNGSIGGYATPNCSSPFRSSSRQSNCSSPSNKSHFNGCDIDVKGPFTSASPNSIRKRKLIDACHPELSLSVAPDGSVESLNEEDDSTLKEIMGKFDEISYTYDKETDILSDSSDHTQCQDHSDYEDTGQEAEDEAEEEEDEIDYIDKNAVSISESVKYKNSGSCEYYEEKSAAQQHQPHPQINRASLKLRKRLRRKSKRSECNTPVGPELSQSRECRSVGGTPILNRRSGAGVGGGKRPQHSVQLNSVDRCNSLSHLNSPQKTLLTIAESEKQLLKSDLEAFMKYRELITEAETILVSFQATDNQPNNNYQHQLGPRNTPPMVQQHQPPHHLPNKRVEMLRAEVTTTKRSDVLTNHHSNNSSPLSVKQMPHHSPLPVHKKIELLKQEQYAFGSPKPSQSSPPIPKKNTKENYPPPYYSPKPPARKHFAAPMPVNCPKSEPLRRKVYGSGGYDVHGSGKQEMILKTLQDLKRKLVEQKSQLYSLNEK